MAQNMIHALHYVGFVAVGLMTIVTVSILAFS